MSADLVTVSLVAAFVAAAVHDMASLPLVAAQGVAAAVLGWLVGWVITRPHDNLDAVSRGFLAGVAMTYLVWLTALLLTGLGGGDLWLMLLCFLVIGMGGWRWLYGFVKAQESIVPKALQRRMDAQERAASPDDL